MSNFSIFKKTCMSTLAAFLILITVSVTIYLPDVKAEESEFEYSLNDDGTITITRYAGENDNIIIPSEIDELIVTAIGPYSFNGREIKSVVIPDTVISIGEGSFFSNEIQSLTLPDSLITIGSTSFAYNAINSLTIPGNVITIGDYSFYGNQLLNLTISEGLTSMGVGAFGENNIVSLTIPNSVISIGEEAFFENNIVNLTISENVSRIEDYTFYNNDIQNLTIPSGVNSIGYFAFGDNEIESVTIPSSVTSIEESAFRDNKLQNLNIPDSVISIGNYAFTENEIENIIIPNSVISIGERAFENNKIVSLIIPDSVTSIGDSAFDFNPHLTNVNILSENITIGSSAFDSKPIITALQSSTAKNYAIENDLLFIGISYSPNGDNSGKVSYETTINLMLPNTNPPTHFYYHWSTSIVQPDWPSADWMTFTSDDTLTTPSSAANWYLHVLMGDELNPLNYSRSNLFKVAPRPSPAPVTSGGSIDVIPQPVTSTNGQLTIPVGMSGEISFEKNITVTIPTGASDEELIITLSKVLDLNPVQVQNEVFASEIFELLKNSEGKFEKPVTLNFVFDSTKVKEGQGVAIFYFDEVKKAWVEVKGSAAKGNQITVDVDHFTKFAVLVVDLKTGFPVSEVATVEESVVSFNDTVRHWAEESITKAVQAGIVNGYADGTFAPSRPVTRAEFIVMLSKALNIEAKEVENISLTFTDSVEIKDWAQKAIENAVKTGIVSGYEDGTFRPNANITRAEMALTIAKALKLSLIGTEETLFNDNIVIPVWAKGAVAALKERGIVNGTNNNLFNPSANATRAEAVVMILNVLNQIN